jgi:hypothetical protein
MTDTTEDNDEQDRNFAKALFRADETETDETDDDPGKPSGNYVPNEGNIPKSQDNSDLALVRILFDN